MTPAGGGRGSRPAKRSNPTAAQRGAEPARSSPEGQPPLIVLGCVVHPDGRALLEAAGRVVPCDDLTEAGMVQVAADVDGAVVRHRPRFTERLMAACPRLRVVGRYGAGLDAVDLDAATRLGIPVVYAPGANAHAAAEHTLLLMLACAKKLRPLDRLTRAGDWSVARYAGITELHGKTLGIIGVGAIGAGVARLARALEMRVLAYDPHLPPLELRRRGADPVETLDALLPLVDVVTCHAPLTAETHHLIDARRLRLMKPGAILVNTSRGRLVDERALYEALKGGELRAAGLDVFEEEPPAPENPLFALDNVVCTPHVAGVSEEADRAIAREVAEALLRVLRGERPWSLANPAVWAHRRGPDGARGGQS